MDFNQNYIVIEHVDKAKVKAKPAMGKKNSKAKTVVGANVFNS